MRFHGQRNGAAVAVGPLEGEILEILWKKQGPQTVPAVYEAVSADGRVISYSAVKAVLNNLAGKGWVRKERSGKNTSFEPLMNRDEFDASVMSSVIGSLKRNYGTPVIAQFVDQLAVDEETIAEFERLLADRKAELGK